MPSWLTPLPKLHRVTALEIIINIRLYKGLRWRPVASSRVSTRGRMEEVRHDAKIYICDINMHSYQRWGEEKTEKEQLATFPAQGRDPINWKLKPVADTAIYTSYSTQQF